MMDFLLLKFINIFIKKLLLSFYLFKLYNSIRTLNSSFINNFNILFKDYLIQFSFIKSLSVVFFKVPYHHIHCIIRTLYIMNGSQNFLFVLIQRVNFLSYNFFNYLSQLDTDAFFNYLWIIVLINHLSYFLSHPILNSLLYYILFITLHRACFFVLRHFSLFIAFFLVLHFTFIIYIKR